MPSRSEYQRRLRGRGDTTARGPALQELYRRRQVRARPRRSTVHRAVVPSRRNRRPRIDAQPTKRLALAIGASAAGALEAAAAIATKATAIDRFTPTRSPSATPVRTVRAPAAAPGPTASASTRLPVAWATLNATPRRRAPGECGPGVRVEGEPEPEVHRASRRRSQGGRRRPQRGIRCRRSGATRPAEPGRRPPQASICHGV